VGLFTSPGLGDFRSRIESNGEWISEADLERCTDLAVEAAGSMDESDPPTEFEVLTAVALVYFASKDLDFVILETGLGGTADSTNIVGAPLVSVITDIGLDHTEHLGDTIEKIAAEKAGIIKRGCPVVTSADEEAARVIKGRADELGALFLRARAALPGVPVSVSSESLAGTTFSCEICGARFDDMTISMPGRHQVNNAVCALAALGVLAENSSELPAPADLAGSVRAAFKAAALPGRFQVVSGVGVPPVILDGAHNPAGAAALSAAVRSFMKGARTLALTSMMRDKQTEDILKEIAGFAEGAVFTEASNDRAIDAALLAAAWPAASRGKAVEAVIRDPREAYSFAVSLLHAGGYDALVVCGSLYLISDIMDAAAQCGAHPKSSA
jgi:dihydrofolate synthase/folylpolyglutamate synthase